MYVCVCVCVSVCVCERESMYPYTYLCQYGVCIYVESVCASVRMHA